MISAQTWKVRQQVLRHYGGVCTCTCSCQETRLKLLQLDHVCGGGNKERQSNRGMKWYRTLLNTPNREDLQVLCVKCHWEKTLFGYCLGHGQDASAITDPPSPPIPVLLPTPHKSTGVLPDVSPKKPQQIRRLPIRSRHPFVASIGRIIQAVRGNHVKPLVMTSDLPAQLISWIGEQESIAGCVAWLTRREIMAALDMKTILAIVVQKEEFIQRFADVPQAPNSQSMYAFYQTKNPPGSHRYRVYGDLRQRAQGRVVMHHKFLVGYTHRFRRGATVIYPQSVWYGSWNFTRGSTNNCDSAMILNDTTVAEKFLLEWWRIWSISDQLGSD